MRDVSQRTLGAMLGMTKKNGSVRINRYEQQTSKVDIETAREIAQLLAVPMSYLFAETDQLARLLLVWSQLPPMKRDQLIEEAVRISKSD